MRKFEWHPRRDALSQILLVLITLGVVGAAVSVFVIAATLPLLYFGPEAMAASPPPASSISTNPPLPIAPQVAQPAPPVTTAGAVTDAQRYALALAAGFSPADAITAVAISIAEDGSGDPSIVSKPNVGVAAGTVDIGLWQINSAHIGSYGIASEAWLFIPINNARAAFAIFGPGRDWCAWSTFGTVAQCGTGHTDAYAQYLGRAAAAGGTTVSVPAAAPLPAGVSVSAASPFSGSPVPPPSDPNLLVETEQSAGPTIFMSSLIALDTSGDSGLNTVIALPLQGLVWFRDDLLRLPAIQEVNDGMVRIVYASVGLVVAALCLWGIIGRAFGSDAREAFSALGKVPLWAALAVTSLAWYVTLIDGMAALGQVMLSGLESPGGGLEYAALNSFGLLTGALYLLILVFVVVGWFRNCAFLLFCAVVAPLFVFSKVTPWTARFGDAWFRMVPAAACDVVAVGIVLGMMNPTLAILGVDSNPYEVLVVRLGMLLCLPMIEHLLGLQVSVLDKRPVVVVLRGVEFVSGRMLHL